MPSPISPSAISAIARFRTVGILVKDHQRSILKHMGNMMSWVVNTKIGHETIFYNEKGQLNPAYNSDINNIKENDWVLYDSERLGDRLRERPYGPRYRSSPDH
jgi:ADP-glucose pyrophosphorylase